MTTLPAHTWNVQQTDLLQKLTEADWALFRHQGTPLMLDKGACINLVDDDSQQQNVYLVTQGYCKLMTLNTQGKRFSISILEAGDFMGNVLYNLEQNARQEEFLEAMAPCQLMRIASPYFNEVMVSNPRLTITIMQNLQGKNRLFHRKLSDLLFKDVHARIAQLFLDLLFNNGEDCPYAFGLKRDLCLRHHEIAELIGASRPVTSLALGDFIKSDLVHKHNGLICLQDLEALKQVAEGGAKALALLAKPIAS